MAELSNGGEQMVVVVVVVEEEEEEEGKGRGGLGGRTGCAE